MKSIDAIFYKFPDDNISAAVCETNFQEKVQVDFELNSYPFGLCFNGVNWRNTHNAYKDYKTIYKAIVPTVPRSYKQAGIEPWRRALSCGRMTPIVRFLDIYP